MWPTFYSSGFKSRGSLVHVVASVGMISSSCHEPCLGAEGCQEVYCLTCKADQLGCLCLQADQVAMDLQLDNEGGNVVINERSVHSFPFLAGSGVKENVGGELYKRRYRFWRADKQAVPGSLVLSSCEAATCPRGCSNAARQIDSMITVSIWEDREVTRRLC